jgi:hypothetical protein
MPQRTSYACGHPTHSVHFLLINTGQVGEIMELGDNIGPIPTPDARELVWLDRYIAKQLAR